MTRPEAPTPELEALFHDLILDHYRRPRNKGELTGAMARGSVANPTCGDEITVEVAVDGDIVRAVRFTGRGCSISQASASMMTGAAQGRTREELRDTADRFGAMLRGETIDADRLGDLRALAGVSRFPARVPCALMAWRALDAALTSADGD
jgi:nitrogen fixation NifU-like protein